MYTISGLNLLLVGAATILVLVAAFLVGGYWAVSDFKESNADIRAMHEDAMRQLKYTETICRGLRNNLVETTKMWNDRYDAAQDNWTVDMIKALHEQRTELVAKHSQSLAKYKIQCDRKVVRQLELIGRIKP